MSDQIKSSKAEEDWIALQMQMGRRGHLCVGAARDDGKYKVKIHLEAASAGRIDASVCYTWPLMKLFVIPYLVILFKNMVILGFVIPTNLSLTKNRHNKKNTAITKKSGSDS